MGPGEFRRGVVVANGGSGADMMEVLGREACVLRMRKAVGCWGRAGEPYLCELRLDLLRRGLIAGHGSKTASVRRPDCLKQ